MLTKVVGIPFEDAKSTAIHRGQYDSYSTGLPNDA